MRISFLIMLIFIILLISWIPQISGASGREIFVSKCGACHKESGEASVFAPTKYASTQWKRFFRRNKHKRKKDITNVFTKNELDFIKNYLIKHAADSDQPEAVGLQ